MSQRKFMACRKTTVYRTVEPRLPSRCCIHYSVSIIKSFLMSRKQEKRIFLWWYCEGSTVVRSLFFLPFDLSCAKIGIYKISSVLYMCRRPQDLGKQLIPGDLLLFPEPRQFPVLLRALIQKAGKECFREVRNSNPSTCATPIQTSASSCQTSALTQAENHSTMTLGYPESCLMSSSLLQHHHHQKYNLLRVSLFASFWEMGRKYFFVYHFLTEVPALERQTATYFLIR